MPRLKKPPPRKVVVDTMCAPAVKGWTTRATRTTAPPPPPPAAMKTKNTLVRVFESIRDRFVSSWISSHATPFSLWIQNDLSNHQARRRRVTGKTEDVAPQPVRRSTRILTSQQPQDTKNGKETTKLQPSRSAATRSGGAAVLTVPAMEQTLRRSLRIRGQKGQDAPQYRDSLQILGNLTIPKAQLVRRMSARTAGTAPLTNDGSSLAGSRKRFTESVSSDTSSKRQKANDDSPEVDRFALPNGVTGTTEFDCEIAPIDQGNFGDVLQVSEYASQIYQHLYVVELRFSAKSYIENHMYLDDIDRYDMIDWLLKVVTVWECEPPVLYLAVQILDRYVSEVPVPLGELAMVGAVALMLASKYEEVSALAVENLLMVVSNCTKSDLVDAERLVLEQLNYGTYWMDNQSNDSESKRDISR